MKRNVDSLKQTYSMRKIHFDLSIMISILFIAIAHLVQFAFNPTEAIQGDSAQYGVGQPRNWDLLSFTGQSLRNWPTVLLYLLFASDAAKIFFQFLISFSATVILLIQINSQFKGRTRVVLIALTSVFVTTPQIMNWNSVLLSESILISTTVLFVVSLRTFVLSNGKFAFWPL